MNLRENGSILGIVSSVKHSKEINLSRIVEVYHDDLLQNQCDGSQNI